MTTKTTTTTMTDNGRISITKTRLSPQLKWDKRGLISIVFNNWQHVENGVVHIRIKKIYSVVATPVCSGRFFKIHTHYFKEAGWSLEYPYILLIVLDIFILAINYHLVMKKHILANLIILLYTITQLFILVSLLKKL